MEEMSIKRKRTLRHFIDAAKEIIEKEGVSKVTARKVGKLSGYSYATIYNYFNDLKELLAYCAFDYLKQCSEEIVSTDIKGLDEISIIQKYNATYFRFFASNPQLFQLVFLEDLDDYPSKFAVENNEPNAGYLLLEHLKNSANKNLIEMKDIHIIHQLNISSIHGKLLFFINNRDQTTIEETLKMLDQEVEFLLGDGIK